MRVKNTLKVKLRVKTTVKFKMRVKTTVKFKMRVEFFFARFFLLLGLTSGEKLRAQNALLAGCHHIQF